MRYLKGVPLFLCLLAVVFWLGALTRCQILTQRYAAQFSVPDGVLSMIGQGGRLKVLQISDTDALVYVYDKATGNSLRFAKQGDGWEYVSWGTVWSKTGSADGFVWPYFYHSGEGAALFLFISIPVLLLSLFILLSGRTRGKVSVG